MTDSSFEIPTEIRDSRYWREAQAREVLELWQGSTLPMTSFAQATGLSIGRLNRWKARLGFSSTSRRSNGVRASSVKPLPFARVHHLVSSSVGQNDAGACGDALELVLPGSRRILVRPGFDTGTLLRLVDLLEC